jgi:pentatricopeptide repeat protein
MISGYVKCGQGQKALDLFQQMQQEGVELDPITLVEVLNVWASVVALDEGMCAHELVMQCGGIQMSFWGVAWWTCMQNVGACIMLAECSIRCQHGILLLGML